MPGDGPQLEDALARYELSDGRSHKFWEITRDGAVITTRWGRIGTAGQEKTKAFATEAKAEAQLHKQIEGKIAKGYGLAATGSAVPASTRSAVPVEASAPPSSAASPAPASADLADGEEAEVPGSGGRTYTLQNVGGVFSCTCPAWRNQSVPIERRTCKHLRRFRGDAAEEARLGALPVRATSRSKEGPPLLLAQSYDPAVHDPTGWWMSEKLDGVRALWDGQRFLSRLGNELLAPDWFVEALPAHPLDGELFGGRGAFQRTVSIVRRADRGEAWRQIRFVVFDAPELEGGFEARLDAVRTLAAAWPADVARVLDHVRCDGPAALSAELARIEALGGEGVMLRQPASAYVAGRSDVLLKVKSFVEAEARVLEHLPGTGRHEGRLGALRVELADGTRFKVGTGFSDAEREHPPPIGAIVTFRYQELTRAGVPRFPSYLRLRPDVDDLGGV